MRRPGRRSGKIMIVYPNAKINIGLSVTEKRADGYHNLETVFYPLTGLRDILELNLSGGAKGVCEFENTGIGIDCAEEKNLVVKAYKLLAAAFGLPGIRVNLHKVIPYGAGLGGGSSDAAFMLKALNEYFNLKISERGLMNYASRLGSDCAFFIRNRPSFAGGRGELLEDTALSLEDYEFLVVKPDCRVSTAEAYAGISPRKAVYNLHNLKDLPIEQWAALVKNDFENTILKKYPEIGRVKNELYEQGAVYASMTGSGSGVYGIFPKGASVVTEPLRGEFVWKEEKEKTE